ncbi:MAG: type II toxin-antitoxin system PemK/MazF family toxin [Mucilaginibacter sp.]
MPKGDIVLITFPFTDLSGTKLRPAVILAEDDDDVTTCFITTKLFWQDPTDLLIEPTFANGLKKSSLIRTGKISTLSISLIQGILGRLTTFEIDDLNKKLMISLQLP